jgi:hypothetical protein
MHLAGRDVEIDAVEGDDVAKAFAERARANRRCRSTGNLGIHRTAAGRGGNALVNHER